MAQNDPSSTTQHTLDDPTEPVPMMQQLLDNPFLRPAYARLSN
jgi:hypothetical protein